MALPNLPFSMLTASKQLISGNFHNAIANILTSTTGTTPVTATPAGTQLTSLQINNAFTEIGTVATAGDGLTLPRAKAGLRCTVTNSGANSAQIFANGADTVQGAAGNVGVALAAGSAAMYICIKDGVWRRFVSA